MAKFEHSWEQRPHLVSLGAEKNYEEFRLRVPENGLRHDPAYFERLVAKAILFRTSEKLVSAQKFGGYRANIVTYTIAKLSHATSHRLDLASIWKRQRLSEATAEAVVEISRLVFAVITDPPERIRNTGEWCKRLDCWKRVEELEWRPSRALEAELLDVSARGDAQPEVNYSAILTPEDSGIIADTAEVDVETWFRVSGWAKATNNLQPWQRGLAFSLGRLASSGRAPSIKQARQGTKLLEEAKRTRIQMSMKLCATSRSQVPVVDLFAGPGGLGEGFSALDGNLYRIAISIEMEETALETLRLRSFFRQFEKGCAPAEYYAYIRGELPITDLKAAYPCEWEQAQSEVWQAELGSEDRSRVRSRVDEALGVASGTGDAVLIGGPPCQAYSLVGRSRMRPVRGKEFESDRRHFLYREYLKILADHAPGAFVLENVRGMLSSTCDGEKIFGQIQADLRYPGKALDDYQPRHRNIEYELFPFGTSRVQANFHGDDPPAESFVVRTDDLGLPQARHRVIIIGVRRDRADRTREVLRCFAGPSEHSTLAAVLQELPRLRSGLSRTADSDHLWEGAVRSSGDLLLKETRSLSKLIRDEIARVLDQLRTPPKRAWWALYRGRRTSPAI